MKTIAPEAAKSAVDAASVVTVVGTLNEWLPPLAAAFTIAWTIIRIYETKTIQRLIHGE
jgi:hypothetical protein